MPVERSFLGWHQPALVTAADRLIERFADGEPIDLSSYTVATPGARAGRRLVELLLDRAGQRAVPLAPPRTVTAESLADALTPRAPGDPPRATPTQRTLAWAAALRAAAPRAIERLTPERPADDDHAAWAALAATVEPLHVELSGERLAFDDVPRRAAGLLNDDESARWVALRRVRDRYDEQLAAAGLADPQAARAHALAADACAATGPVVLVGLSDFGEQLSAMLDAVAERHPVEAWVFAPDALADRFDAWGRVVADAWADAAIELDDERVAVVASPADQANETLKRIDALGGAYAADQITIGVADDALGGALRQQFGAYDLPVRFAAGRPLDQAPPMRLLAAVADFAASSSFGGFASLLRHPDVSAWLARVDAAGVGIDLWLTALDRYHADHLQSRVSAEWLGTDRVREPMRTLWHAMHDGVDAGDTMLGSLAGVRPLADWADPIAGLLATVYGGRTLHRHDPADRAVIEACERIGNALDELRHVGAALGGPASAAEALRLVQARLAGDTVPAEADPDAIEALGWLEVALDDAPVVIVTGVNEGRLPASVNAHPFLPESLRRALGLTDNARRYARDAAALSAVLACRAEVTLIAGRRDAGGDPAQPSRLLLTGAGDRVARRVSRWFGDEPTESPLAPPPRFVAGSDSAFAPPPEPVITAPAPDYMTVTEFRDYLDDPYLYALSHRCGLGAIGDAAREMDGGAFGTLAHDVLEAFGRSDRRDADTADEVGAALDGLLDRAVARRFGDAPLPAVRVQVEQLRERLRWFADWQADRAAAGWRIVQTELKFGKRTTPGRLDAGDGAGPMLLHGKIDRVDYHPDLKRWAVFDYKTANRATEPDRSHRRGRGDARRWVDLQLPLYRKLLEQWADDAGRPRLTGEQIDGLALGYIVLPRSRPERLDLYGGWSADELRDADEAAAGVVRAVRAGRYVFDPHSRAQWYDFAGLVGADQFVSFDDEAEGGEDG